MLKFFSCFSAAFFLVCRAQSFGVETDPLISWEKSPNNFPVRFLFPGTNWCGDGDRATHYEDLGYFRNSDICCRGHDLCPQKIYGLSENYGLKNNDPFTRSHCDCDKRFYDCLMKESTFLNRFIVKLYFFIIPDQCFRKKESPGGITTGKDVYEWVDTTEFMSVKEELYAICKLDIKRMLGL